MKVLFTYPMAIPLAIGSFLPFHNALNLNLAETQTVIYVEMHVLPLTPHRVIYKGSK
jgi:hypothetical protein